MKSFQHPELMQCNPLAESINEDNNEDNERINESSDIITSDQPNFTKAQINTNKPNYHQQQYHILHPDFPTNSNLVTSSNQTFTPNIPTTRIPTTNIQNVCPPTTINLNQQQPISTNYMVGTAGPGATYRYRPTLGQKILVDSALKRNRRHTLANIVRLFKFK